MGQGSEAADVRGRLASWDYFPLLGVTPSLGRFFAEEDDALGAPLTVVLGYEFWQRALGGDRDILGRTLDISGFQATVLGVTPRGFTGTSLQPTDLWLPLLPTEEYLTGGATWMDARQWWWLSSVVRLADGVTEEAASLEATRLHRTARAEEIAGGNLGPGQRIALSKVTGFGTSATEARPSLVSVLRPRDPDGSRRRRRDRR